MRDDFNSKTLRTLAARVGYHCSNPDCMSSTNGPALDEDQTVNIGVGAHITAASPDGPRYDRNLSSTERKSGNNGIWLCQSCSKLIDSDELRYTVESLRKWKEDAVHRAQQSIAGGRPLGCVKPTSDLDDVDQQFLRGLDLPSSDAVETVCSRLRDAARSDVAAFQATPQWPTRAVILTLSLVGDSSRTISISGIAGLAALAEPVSIISPPGAGKSTTLVQLADSMLAEDGPIPLLVPLSEWSDREDDFFEFIMRRNSFGGFRRVHLMQLAYYGKLTLLLDGWNEIAQQSRVRAIRDVKSLQRDYPLLGMVVGTRMQPVKLAGPVVEIQPLSEDQQLEFANALRGSEGQAIIDRAWRTNGVRELISVPLYLKALLSLPPGARFPQTKEALLRMFVQQHEALPERAEILHHNVLGFHSNILIDLAVEATRTGNTVVSGNNARRTISTTMRGLANDGQLTTQLQPGDILTSLVDSHLLTFSSTHDTHTFAFQHQQFQEWYAATHVEELMLKAATGDIATRKALREEVLNWVNWEESVLFACERLSRANESGARSVAFAIKEALSIDPILGAEIIYRSSNAAWEFVRECVVRFAERWHRPDSTDRALRFMMLTGKPEFSEHVWPMIAHPDGQIRRGALLTSYQLRPTVLGEDREVRLRALPTGTRRDVLSEIASKGDFDGMELAAAIAASDPDPNTVVAVVQSLEFRSANRHINQVLQAAQDDIWTALGNVIYPSTLTDSVLNGRLLRAREMVRMGETDPLRLLRRYVRDRPRDAATRITELIASPQLAFNGIDTEHATKDAFDGFPEAVAVGITQRIVLDLPLPLHAISYLDNIPLVDEGPLVNIVLAPETPKNQLLAGIAMVGARTVGKLLDRLFEFDDQRESSSGQNRALFDAHSRLSHAIQSTRQEAFVSALLPRAAQNWPHRIGLMAELLAQHGSRDGKRRPPIINAHRLELRRVMQQWIETLLQAPAPARYHCSRLALAAERLADPELAEPIRRLFERDLTDWLSARSAYLSSPHGPMHGEASTSYSNLYSQAFQSMRGDRAITVLKHGLSDLRWGRAAAGALLGLWKAVHHSGESRRFFGWNDFSQHWSHRLKQQNSITLSPTSEFAECIFAVAHDMGQEDKSETEQQHAIDLAVVGLALPHGNKRQIIDTLLALPQPVARKLRLLAAAAMAGEILPSALLLKGVADFLIAAQTQQWRFAENRGELMGWIELFPFSEEPATVLNAIASLPEQHRRPSKLERLLGSLPHGNPPQSLDVLQRLADSDPTFAQHQGWMKAMIDLNTEESAIALFARICDGRIDKPRDMHLWVAMAAWATKYPALREAMLEQYRVLPVGNVRSTIEMALLELGDEEVFWVLFERYATEHQTHRSLSMQIRRLAIGRRPSEAWSGAYEEYGLPLTELRVRLFSVTGAGDGRAKLAEQCLADIDECRDEYGRIQDEPRHPDISAGRPWPLAADI